MKKYIKPAANVLDFNLENYLQVDGGNSPYRNTEHTKGSDWVVEDDYDEGDGLW